MTYRHASLGMLAVLAITGCPDDATPADTDTETGSSSSGESSNTNPTTTTATTADTSTSATTADTSSSEAESSTTPPEESSSDSGPDLMPAEFRVTIENISATSTMPTTISAGVWVEQELGTMPIFSIDMADRGEGLVALAEDGDPTELAMSVQDADGWVQSGTWDTAIAPGEMVEFTLTADPGSGAGLANRLGFMAGVGAGNDVFLGTGPNGVALFTNGGLPMDEHDISDVLALWDVGSEYNQAPGQGFDQQQTQAAADTGMVETGTVWAFSSSTRAVPQASKVLTWDVDHDMKNPDTVIITLTNTSSTIAGDFGDLVWALHDDTASIFTAGGAASDVAGLEELAEDGDGATYQATLAGTAGVASADLIAGGVGPGETFVITVTPDGANRFLSFATSLAATNDAFVAPAPGGIALAAEDGTARTNGQIEEDLRRLLITWDAGTEQNEVPGVGNNIQAEQALPDLGTIDSDATIRPYNDMLNDFDGPSIGGMWTVTVEDGGAPGELDVTIENTSGGTAYPALFSAPLWAVHDDTVSFFDAGMPASPSLETLAEDGDPSALLGDLGAGVSASDVAPMPLGTGASFQFTIAPDETTPNLSVIAMVIPSNDTFVALTVPLVDGGGAVLSAAEAEAAIAAALGAWEAGTEANQSGGAGRDQYPQQAADNTGANEGDPLIRTMDDDDPIWAWPDANTLVRVTVTPTGN